MQFSMTPLGFQEWQQQWKIKKNNTNYLYDEAYDDDNYDNDEDTDSQEIDENNGVNFEDAIHPNKLGKLLQDTCLGKIMYKKYKQINKWYQNPKSSIMRKNHRRIKQ